jgi:signal transduction histidine kinase
MATASSPVIAFRWLKFPQTAASRIRIAIVLTFSVIAVWTIAILFVDQVPAAAVHPAAHGGIEAIAAMALGLSALVLVLFPERESDHRLYWAAAGLALLAITGVLMSLATITRPELFTIKEIFEISIVARTAALGLICVGLATSNAPTLNWANASLATLAIGLFAGAVFYFHPETVEPSAIASVGVPGDLRQSEFTMWHWILSAIPLAMALLIVWRQASLVTRQRVPAWLIIAALFLAASQLHNSFWPSIYGPIVSTADVLRMAFATTVLLGTIIDLRSIAIRRAEEVALEKTRAHRLEELQVLRANFARTAAHELSNPLAAINRYADALTIDDLPPELRTSFVKGIEQEASLIRRLIDDLHTAGVIESQDFTVEPKTIPLSSLFDDAVNHVQSLERDRIVIVNQPDVTVRGDPDRIGQVLRNLLSNALRYAPDGSPIELNADHNGSSVTITVRDYGRGIAPEEHERVFEMFGRGRSDDHSRTPGMGLGLYISRRILRMHGSDLLLNPVDGSGACFAFSLETTPASSSN